MTQRESLKLSGGQAEAFRELRQELADELGYTPTRPRVISHLLEHYDGDLMGED